ncbi:hypothetical protein BKA81DRAFT_383435 [Phyllosticta paracitricarpa]|uniref:Uncharacterized protein n=1 Tax=Phyllosticta paracitricarpa TaxID=2016321 RepID=A0ABR1NF78_9PEZI
MKPPSAIQAPFWIPESHTLSEFQSISYSGKAHIKHEGRAKMKQSKDNAEFLNDRNLEGAMQPATPNISYNPVTQDSFVVDGLVAEAAHEIMANTESECAQQHTDDDSFARFVAPRVDLRRLLTGQHHPVKSDGEAVELGENTPQLRENAAECFGRTDAEGFTQQALPLPVEELTMDELVESVSVSGYWEIAAEKVVLLGRFFSVDEVQQVMEEAASFRLANRVYKTRIVQMSLVLVYLEKGFGEHQQLLDLLLKKARLGLQKSLPDDVNRNEIQSSASAAWQEQTEH